MRITGQNYHISQREYENGACDVSNRQSKRNISSEYMQLFTIFSILDVTWYQLSIIGFLGSALLRLGIM
jgi:hypothetical protein